LAGHCRSRERNTYEFQTDEGNSGFPPQCLAKQSPGLSSNWGTEHMTIPPNHDHPDLESRIASLERLIALADRPVSVSSKPVSIQEFIISRGPRSETEKTLVIAYYLEKYEKKVPFNIESLREAYGRAKEPGPKNLNDAVNKNIQKGLIMESSDRMGKLKAWVVTSSGERLVSDRLSEDRTSTPEP
jgi:hypothetical protein